MFYTFYAHESNSHGSKMPEISRWTSFFPSSITAYCLLFFLRTAMILWTLVNKNKTRIASAKREKVTLLLRTMSKKSTALHVWITTHNSQIKTQPQSQHMYNNNQAESRFWNVFIVLFSLCKFKWIWLGSYLGKTYREFGSLTRTQLEIRNPPEDFANNRRLISQLVL